MPPRKKQKTKVVAEEKEQTPKPPTVFQAAGLQPDVRLKVFDEQFIVHSPILKLYSTFFLKFLDSPDKQLNHDVVCPSLANGRIFTVVPSTFKYEWVTEVEDDGGWHLVAESSIGEVRVSCFYMLE